MLTLSGEHAVVHWIYSRITYQP